MIGNKRIVCVIPARLRSSRFPGKVLASLGGKPLLQWAYEGALQIPFFDDVALAIDAEETQRVIEGFGGKYFMTSVDHPVGTDRIIEVKKRGLLQGDIWVNWQADEPFLSAQVFSDLLQSCEGEGADIWTLKQLVREKSKIHDPNLPKVVCDFQGNALYFSRSSIPYHREEGEEKIFRHIGLYAYSAEALEKISCMQPCALEQWEALEQLRWLFYGIRIRVHETQEESIGIDLPEHLVCATEYLKNREKAFF